MVWELNKADVERISIGAGILGTGGGGNPYRGMIRTQAEIDKGNTVNIVKLDELPDDALVVPLAGIGAPTIGLEKIGRGDEGRFAVEELQKYLGVDIAATIPVEIGGGNSFAPMIAGAQLGLPTVDADGMGRAFPESSMISFYFDGVASPTVLMTDAQRHKIIIENVQDTKALERISRAVAVQLGGGAMVASHPITVRKLKETSIPDTITLAHRVGDAVLQAQQHGDNPVRAVCDATGGQVLFTGKITDVDRRFERGFNFGQLTLQGLDGFQGSVASIDLQNEFLICRVDSEVVAIVPDLITLVDSERGEPITTEVVRYGLRVAVVGIPAPVQLTTEQAMQYVGPHAFGYDLPFTPLSTPAIAAD